MLIVNSANAATAAYRVTLKCRVATGGSRVPGVNNETLTDSVGCRSTITLNLTGDGGADPA